MALRAVNTLANTFEQWIEGEMRHLGEGDAAFIPAGTVDASFNAADGDSKALAIIGPVIGEMGFEFEDLSGEAPWSTLR